MTNIILKIETNNDKNHALMKKNAQEILNQANEVYAPKMGDDALGSDDYREWLFANHKDLAEYLYDELGKANKKGEQKPVMSQHKKNIFAGIKTIATRNDDFMAWCDSDSGRNVSSLAKVTSAVNSYLKSLEAPAEKSGAGDDETESAGDDGAISLEDMAREIITKLGKDAAMQLSTMIWDLADGEIADEKQSATA